MKHWHHWLLSAAILGTTCAVAQAQEANAQQENPSTSEIDTAAHADALVKRLESANGNGATNLAVATEMIATAVVDAEFEDLGTIEDIVLDANQKRIAYLVLSYGGVLGIGDKLFAVPYSAFRPGTGKQQLVLDVDAESLENAPGFDPYDWPDMGDPEFHKGVHGFYQADRYDVEGERERPGKTTQEDANDDFWTRWTTRDGDTLWSRRLSELIGMDLVNANDEGLATLEDVIIDNREGRLTYGILSHGGFGGFFDNTAAVPWNALTLEADNEVFSANLTEADLEQAAIAGYDELIDRNFAQGIYDHFGEVPYWERFGYQGSATAAAPHSDEEVDRTTKLEEALRQAKADAKSKQSQNEQDHQESKQSLTGNEQDKAEDEKATAAKKDPATDANASPQAQSPKAENTDAAPNADDNQARLSKLLEEAKAKSAEADAGKNGDEAPSQKEREEEIARMLEQARAESAALKEKQAAKNNKGDATAQAHAAQSNSGNGASNADAEKKPTKTAKNTAGESPHGNTGNNETKNSQATGKAGTPDDAMTVTGTIRSVGTYYENGSTGIRIRIESEDGTSYPVMLGVPEIVKVRDLRPRKGDTITVTGTTTEKNGRTSLVAREIEKDGKQISLAEDKDKTPTTKDTR